MSDQQAVGTEEKALLALLKAADTYKKAADARYHNEDATVLELAGKLVAERLRS